MESLEPEKEKTHLVSLYYVSSPSQASHSKYMPLQSLPVIDFWMSFPLL